MVYGGGMGWVSGGDGGRRGGNFESFEVDGFGNPCVDAFVFLYFRMWMFSI